MRSVVKTTEPFALPGLDRLPAELRDEVLGPRRSLNVHRMIMHTPGLLVIGKAGAAGRCRCPPTGR